MKQEYMQPSSYCHNRASLKVYMVNLYLWQHVHLRVISPVFNSSELQRKQTVNNKPSHSERINTVMEYSVGIVVSDVDGVSVKWIPSDNTRV